MDLDGISALNLFSRFTALASDPRRKELIEKLPALSEDDLTSLDQKDSCCPICFTPFLAILASEEMALAMETPALSAEELGVTRLADTCGHIFCRKDITTWIRQHDTCPTCRQPFITGLATSTNVGAPQNNTQDPEDDNIIHMVLGSELGFLVEGYESMGSQAHRSTVRDSTDATVEQEGTQQNGANHDDSRSEFVGMYS